MTPLLVTLPHSGEKIPPEAHWLQGLPKQVLLRDVDRFVDWLYQPALADLKIPFVKTEWHRYAGDLNRLPEDIDASTVAGNPNPAGKYDRGFLWGITTYEESLILSPVSAATHQALVQRIYEPFHAQVNEIYKQFRQQGHRRIFHIDAHSMPSLGTKMHRDPGQTRADIVVSDCKGLSCSADFRDVVISAYCVSGFKVAYNWPYFGGRLTEQYGAPAQGHEAIQVEMSRSLYMDEVTKELKPDAAEVQKKIGLALAMIKKAIEVKLTSEAS